MSVDNEPDEGRKDACSRSASEHGGLVRTAWRTLQASIHRLWYAPNTPERLHPRIAMLWLVGMLSAACWGAHALYHSLPGWMGIVAPGCVAVYAWMLWQYGRDVLRLLPSDETQPQGTTRSKQWMRPADGIDEVVQPMFSVGRRLLPCLMWAFGWNAAMLHDVPLESGLVRTWPLLLVWVGGVGLFGMMAEADAYVLRHWHYIGRLATFEKGPYLQRVRHRLEVRLVQYVLAVLATYLGVFVLEVVVGVQIGVHLPTALHERASTQAAMFQLVKHMAIGAPVLVVWWLLVHIDMIKLERDHP